MTPYNVSFKLFIFPKGINSYVRNSKWRPPNSWKQEPPSSAACSRMVWCWVPIPEQPPALLSRTRIVRKLTTWLPTSTAAELVLPLTPSTSSVRDSPSFYLNDFRSYGLQHGTHETEHRKRNQSQHRGSQIDYSPAQIPRTHWSSPDHRRVWCQGTAISYDLPLRKV